MMFDEMKLGPSCDDCETWLSMIATRLEIRTVYSPVASKAVFKSCRATVMVRAGDFPRVRSKAKESSIKPATPRAFERGKVEAGRSPLQRQRQQSIKFFHNKRRTSQSMLVFFIAVGPNCDCTRAWRPKLYRQEHLTTGDVRSSCPAPIAARTSA